MKPLYLLIAVFILFTIISKFTTGNYNVTAGGNLAMCMMLFLTAIGHMLFTKGMVMMMPPFIPYKAALVYITGIVEILIGVALLFPVSKPYSGCFLIVFLILILPANIYGAVKHVDLQQATYTGPGPNYLWFRIPEQVFYIGWVYYFSVK
ncbi:MAG: hypothetical protein EOP47_19715 [Sphingobacteriaceae bacterium]|nr:MAG: hypothetical protein EOP47_19715 [Sphingobacteriaceae bacterium]